MKIQLDTTAKTVKVEGSVKLSELIETLDKILPGIWKEFTLEANTTIINWSNPIYVTQPKYEPYWYKDKVTCQDDKMLCGGTYNIEC